MIGEKIRVRLSRIHIFKEYEFVWKLKIWVMKDLYLEYKKSRPRKNNQSWSIPLYMWE